MLLATAGHERKVVIWDLEKDQVNFGEGHADFITDVRFKPNSTVIATSSFDRTVMIWDAAMCEEEEEEEDEQTQVEQVKEASKKEDKDISVTDTVSLMI
ncbi:hypothetical protein K7X08_033593 [Anisodus acutangulus]|uniref:Transducin n=1 Tax=Anisodus acutangulus TaxID=402998 RepID=A0A9Q1RCA2_9SOLA|nr:hypothetical protein K7X08_033593 [Anisodus acutangulus]